MASWATKRRIFYLSLVLLFLLLLGLVFYLIFLRRPPTCFDDKKNQNELDVDCGGICSKVCKVEVSPLIKVWTRTFAIGEGQYDVATLIENPNFNLALEKLSYTFKLYDRDNLFITEKKGSVFVNAKDKFIIFESNLDTGKRIPQKALIEFDENLVWTRADPQKSKPPLVVQNKKLSEGAMPRLTAELINSSIFDLTDINVTTVVYDEDGNAMASSQTFLNYIGRGGLEKVVFTWPKSFSSKVSIVEIYPRVNLTSKGD